MVTKTFLRYSLDPSLPTVEALGFNISFPLGSDVLTLLDARKVNAAYGCNLGRGCPAGGMVTGKQEGFIDAMDLDWKKCRYRKRA